jgi:hypothetical protein
MRAAAAGRLTRNQFTQCGQRGRLLGRAPDEGRHDVAVHLGQGVPSHGGVLDGVED